MGRGLSPHVLFAAKAQFTKDLLANLFANLLTKLGFEDFHEVSGIALFLPCHIPLSAQNETFCMDEGP